MSEHRQHDTPRPRPGGVSEGDTEPIPIQLSGTLDDDIPVDDGELFTSLGARAPAEPTPRRRIRPGEASGLLAVAVLAGLLWWFIRQDDDQRAASDAGQSSQSSQPSEPGEPNQTGERTQPNQPDRKPERVGDTGYFVEVAPVHARTCRANSYGRVTEFFADTDCRRLSRALYTIGRGAERVLVSVSVVQMPRPAGAAALKRMTDTSGTGNVADLVRAGRAGSADLPKVSGGAYASAVSGNRVTIVEAAAFKAGVGEQRLTEAATGALRLGNHTAAPPR
ncbi:hypothetical protein EV191_11316 [Tamaricihabitans halophyticus]|uniref:Uncharacterized protein n=1 Tax=Tamaricihabitans halophyticus TaxID=1262583 RepID=A0A4R2QCJ9_9PSEU|nr:hypothetical protein [Tamaricihabitans halophyticus]TCP46740.1 hypothetical protein EV191_11316 [Tamaricihabitans halophyticus]